MSIAPDAAALLPELEYFRVEAVPKAGNAALVAYQDKVSETEGKLTANILGLVGFGALAAFISAVAPSFIVASMIIVAFFGGLGTLVHFSSLAASERLWLKLPEGMTKETAELESEIARAIFDWNSEAQEWNRQRAKWFQELRVWNHRKEMPLEHRPFDWTDDFIFHHGRSIESKLDELYYWRVTLESRRADIEARLSKLFLALASPDARKALPPASST